MSASATRKRVNIGESNLSDLIRESLKEAGMTQTQLADRLETNPVGFNAAMNGKRKFTQKIIPGIAKFIGVNEADVLRLNSAYYAPPTIPVALSELIKVEELSTLMNITESAGGSLPLWLLLQHLSHMKKNG